MYQVIARTKPLLKTDLVYSQYQVSISRKSQEYSIIFHTVPYPYETLSAMEKFSEYPIQ